MLRYARKIIGWYVLQYVPFIIFLVVFFAGLNASYPMLGHDYFYAFPRLLAGKWHFLAQGFVPFRYAVQLCGGFPVYGNPHDMFYSLPQLLSLFLGLWTATQLSIAVALIAGYAGWVLFARRAIGLSQEWSHVLALIVIANGYYFMHMIVGHLTYHTLPLMGWFLWLLFAREADDKRSFYWKAALFGFLSAYVLYSGGYFVLLLTSITAVLLVPIKVLLGIDISRQHFRTISLRAAWFGAAALALCMSKLVAVYSLMRFFPRSITFDQFPEESSGLLFILQSFFVFPQGSFLFDPNVNTWGIHEYSMFLSPLVLIGCAAAIWILAREKRLSGRRASLLGIFVLLVALFFVQLARGHGVFVDWLEIVPIVSSFRVTVRFLYVPAVLLSIGGVIGLSWIANRIPFLQQRHLIVPIAGVVTILGFLVAYVPMLSGTELQLTVPYSQVQEGMTQSNYLTKSITGVESSGQDMSSDLHHIFSASTGDDCYEPLLAGNTILKPLQDGPVRNVTDNSFNLRNPACLQYPGENNCVPGDRISEEDEENLTAITNGLPVTWKLSLAQVLADALTLLSLIGALGILCWHVVRLPHVTETVNAWWKRRHKLQTPVIILASNVRTLLLKENTRPAEGFRNFLIAALLIIGLTFVAYICAFKLLDRDFWWHITAGRIMVDTGRLITTEPFAYTRAGLPYLANHEWLAQVMLYLLYAGGGSIAVIFFRTAAMAVSVGLLFFIDTKRTWLYAPLAILAANAIRPAFIERPQLFTFMLFSVGLLLTFRTIATLNERMFKKREWLRLCAFFLVVQILWVNTHGAAGLAALVFPVVLFIDQARVGFHRPTLQWIAVLGAVLVVGLFLSPITYENITYIWNLFTDRTMQYIGEWRPREWGEYLRLIGPFWVIGVAAIAAGRRNILACVFLLLVTGYVGRDAMRQEPLFVLSVVAIAIHQLRFWREWNVWERWLLKRRIFTILLLCATFFLLFRYVHAQYVGFTVPERLQGYGQFDFGKNAVDFLEREDIQGTMFNSYGFGGYLIYRGYPDRHVFIDGRNVDHGFALMNLAYLAGQDPAQWQKMEEKFGFTYAVVDYPANTNQEKKTIEYAQHLDTNPEWPLVYVDDWVAIYLKDTPENRAIIDRFAYTIVRTTNLEFGTLLDTTPQEQWPLLEAELQQSIDADPRSIKARLVLGTLLIRQQRFDEAYAVIQDALIVWPEKPEAHALLGGFYVAQERWPEAADAFADTLSFAGSNYPNIDYGVLARVFANAGRMREANIFARKAGAALTPRRDNPEPVTGTTGQVPMVNPAQDAIEFENQALALAKAGRLTEAREQFLNALKLNPRYAEGWSNLGTLSFQEGKLEEAKTQYLRALEEWPEFPDATYNMAIVSYHLGDLKAAKTYAAKAKKLGMDTASIEALLKEKR